MYMPHLNGDDQEKEQEHEEDEVASALEDVLYCMVDSLDSIDAKLDVIMSQLMRVKRQ